MKAAIALSVFGLLMSSQAEAQTSRCEGTDARACHQQNLKEARKTLDRAITDTCRKQGFKGGELLACRADLMTKTAQGIR